MKTLAKVVTFQGKKDLCMLNKNSGYDNLNPVPVASSTCKA